MTIFEIAKNAKHGFASVHTLANVDSKCRKSFPIKGIVCEKVQVVLFGCKYESMVNRAIDRAELDAEFKAEGLPWGEWVKGLEGRVIEHKGSYYLRAYQPVTIECTYTINGVKATDAEVAMIEAEIYRNANGSKKQAAAGLSTEEQVKVVAFQFDKITEFHAGGYVFNVNEEIAVAV